MLDTSAVRPPNVESRRTAAGAFNRDRVAYRVAREMAIWILDSGLPEGSRLPPEMELGDALGASRTGVRSALRLLESWGLVAIQTGRYGGPVVRRPRVSDLKDTLSVLIHSEHATLMDVLTARRAIDPIIAAEAAERATPDDLKSLDEAIGRLRRASLTQRDFLAATSQFQSVLAEASHLVILGLLLRILASFGETALMQRVPFDDDWRQQVLGSFEKIRTAVAEHDREAARAMMLLLRMESDWHWQERGAALLQVPLEPFEFGS